MLGVDYVIREFNNAQNSLTLFCHCDYWGRGVVRRPARIRKTVCNKWRGHQRNGSRGLFHDVKTSTGQCGLGVQMERGHMTFCIGRKSADV